MKNAAKILAKKEYPSDLSLLPEIQAFVKEKILQFVPAEKLDAIILAVSEAVSNGIRHGNKSDKNKKIEVMIYKTDDAIVISSLDEGKGFDLSKIPDPTNPENLLKESGRGIFIIQNVIDDLSYEFTDKGTKTILTIKTK
jgi:serine/threonine-protein kinase RsbW